LKNGFDFYIKTVKTDDYVGTVEPDVIIYFPSIINLIINTILIKNKHRKITGYLSNVIIIFYRYVNIKRGALLSYRIQCMHIFLIIII